MNGGFPLLRLPGAVFSLILGGSGVLACRRGSFPFQGRFGQEMRGRGGSFIITAHGLEWGPAWRRYCNEWGGGVFTGDGPSWPTYRFTFQPALVPPGLLVVEDAGDRLRGWTESSAGQPW